MTETQQPGALRMIFRGIWSAFNGVRRFVFGVIAILILLGGLIGLGGDGKTLEAKTALVIPISGNLVEQFSGSAQDLAVAQAFGDESMELRIRDVRIALELAAKDPKIDRVFLRVAGDFGAGQVGLRELVDALQKFKKDSGKEILAYGNNYAQRGLFVAAAADKVYMHPEGLAMLEGLGRSRTYYKSALEKLGVKVNVFRVGTFKSAVEPYLLDGPSEAAIEADLFWLNDLWTRFLEDYSAMRKTNAVELRAMIDDLPARLIAVGGNVGKLAVQAKLVDELKTPDEMRDMLIKKGARDTSNPTSDRVDYRKVSLSDYLAFNAEKIKADANEAKIAVVVAEGGISDGSAPQGEIGGDSTAALIRKAREDKDIQALVLRVNSPGGSGFASEVIRREMQLTQQAGKTVFVSMGDIAASGGYWISMASDGVFAHPSTITGSIGIFSILPNAQEGLNKIGIYGGGASTTWLANAGDPARPLDPRLADTMQTLINHGYQNFISKVGASRKKTPEQINEVAQGRVWSGAQAKSHGLVDQFGLLEDAIKAAAKKAKIESTSVRYIEEEPEGFAAFLQSFKASVVLGAAKAMDDRSFAQVLLSSDAQQQARSDLKMFVEARDNPFQTFAHCFCELK